MNNMNKEGSVIEISARGIVQVSEYGLMVDDADVLKAINKHFDKEGKGRTDFAGRIKILIIDETEPMKVTDKDELLKEAEDFFNKLSSKKATFDPIKGLLDDLLKEPIIK